MLYYLTILIEKCDCFKDRERQKQKDKEMLEMINDLVKTQTELVKLYKQKIK